MLNGYIQNGLTRWSKDDEVQIIEAPGNYRIKVDRWYYNKNCLYNWRVVAVVGREYVYRVAKGNKRLWMARDVLELTDSSIQVDHINGDTLDNRECNLRVCTSAQNSYNKKKSDGKTSVFKGVSRRNNKFHASIGYKGKRISLGCHSDEVTAALVYDSAAVYLFRGFAKLNFPEHKNKLLEECRWLMFTPPQS